MNYLDQLIHRYPQLQECGKSVEEAYNLLERCFLEGNKLLLAGNGGSCADCEHIVGELMKGFKLERKCSSEFASKLKNTDGVLGSVLAENLQGGLPAIALTGHQALNTAFANDVEDGGVLAFAQQVYGYGRCGDVLLCISTSGNSENILYAAVVAKALGIKVIGLTGAGGGKLSEIADVTICVPQKETFMVQELHLPVYHCLCLMLEERFFG